MTTRSELVSRRQAEIRGMEKRGKRAGLEERFVQLWAARYPHYAAIWIPQFKIPQEKFVWDFGTTVGTGTYWNAKIVVEIQGGQFMQKSGHSNVQGQERDARKLNTASAHGYRSFWFTSSMLRTGEGLDLLADAVRGKV